MIITLAREQWRAYRKFQTWTAALVAVGVALVSFAAVASATQAHIDRLSWRATVSPSEHTALVSWWTDGASDQPLLPHKAVTSTAELERIVSDSRARGTEMTIRREGYVYVWPAGDVGELPPFESMTMPVAVMAEYPSSDWSSVLVEGEAPTPGGIVVSADTANRLRLEVGDRVDVQQLWGEMPIVAEGVTVTGLSRPSSVGVFQLWLPVAYVVWEEAAVYTSFLPASPDDNAPTPRTELASALVSWNGNDDEAESMGVDAETLSMSSEPRPFAMTGTGMASIAAAVLVVLAVIAASFGMGRSSAHARVNWVATARALGARRRTLVAASALETTALALVASVAGVALGWCAALVVLAIQRSAAPGSLLPVLPSLPAWGIVAAGATGLIVSGIVAAVPTFWATRVSPVAGLKAVAPVTEQNVSRTVSGWWLVGVTATAILLLAAAGVARAFDTYGWGARFEAVGVLVILVVVIANAVELSRRTLTRVSRVLSSRGSPASIAAGTSLHAHARQSAVASAVIACGVMTALVIGRLTSLGEGGLQGTSAAVAAGTMALATVVALAVTSTARAVARPDAEVMAALGLDHGGARRASALEVVITHLVGAFIGMVLAAGAWGVWWASHSGDPGQQWAIGGIALTFVTVGVAAVACAGAASAISGAALRHRDGPPVAVRERAPRVRDFSLD